MNSFSWVLDTIFIKQLVAVLQKPLEVTIEESRSLVFHGFSISYAQFGKSFDTIFIKQLIAVLQKSLEVTVVWDRGLVFQIFVIFVVVSEKIMPLPETVKRYATP